MPHSIRWFLPLSLLALAACGHTSAPATTNDTATAAAPAATEAAPPAPADAGDDGFVMTMDKFDAYLATIRKVSTTLMAAHAGHADSDEDEDEDDPIAMEGSETIDQYIARINADPKAKALVTSAGMSVSDYAHTSEALLGGMMTAGALKSGALKKIPDGINPQYVRFAQEHEAEINAKMAELQKMGSGG